MNAPSHRQRLRDADPAAQAEPALTAEQLLGLAQSDYDPLAGTQISARPRHLARRVSLVAAVAAVVALVPVFWPNAHSTIPTSSALAVDVADGAANVTIPLNQVVSAAMLQAGLDKAHLTAKVYDATPDCTQPAQPALPVDDVFVAERPTGTAQRVTFYPANIPAGTHLVFSLETHDGGTAASWGVYDHLPNCVPLSTFDGAVFPSDTATPTTS